MKKKNKLQDENISLSSMASAMQGGHKNCHSAWILLVLGRIAVWRYGVAWSVCLLVCHSREPCKNSWTDQMPFGLRTRMGLRKHVLDKVHISATWQIRLCGDDVALCWNTLTTCYLKCNFWLRLADVYFQSTRSWYFQITKHTMGTAIVFFFGCSVRL